MILLVVSHTRSYITSMFCTNQPMLGIEPFAMHASKTLQAFHLSPLLSAYLLSL